MEEAPENGMELSHSARANGMNEWMQYESRWCNTWLQTTYLTTRHGNKVLLKCFTTV